MLCERVSNINKISFHAHSLSSNLEYMCVLKATSSIHLLYITLVLLMSSHTKRQSSIDSTVQHSFHKNHCSYKNGGKSKEVKNWSTKNKIEGKKITFINLYFVSIDRNCQIHKKERKTLHLC